MKDVVILSAFIIKKVACCMHAFFYPHINYQGYQQAPADKCRLHTQDRTLDFAVSSQPLNSLLESSRVLDAIATKAKFTMDTYQAGYLT